MPALAPSLAARHRSIHTPMHIMKKRHTGPLVLSLLVLASACGSAGDDSDATRASGRASADAHPCDVFTADDVASMFDVPAASVTERRNAVPGNLACSYKWGRADAEAVKERNRELVMAAMTSGGGGIPSFESEEASLLITFHEAGYGSTADAVGGFDEMVQNLTRGIPAGDGAPDYQATFQPIAGLGAKAAWSDELRQVSAVGGTRLYHVMLNTGAERGDDRAAAEAVARRIAASL